MLNKVIVHSIEDLSIVVFPFRMVVVHSVPGRSALILLVNRSLRQEWMVEWYTPVSDDQWFTHRACFFHRVDTFKIKLASTVYLLSRFVWFFVSSNMSASETANGQYSDYRSPFSTRYASKEMRFNFSDQNKFSTWRKLWVYLAEAQMVRERLTLHDKK